MDEDRTPPRDAFAVAALVAALVAPATYVAIRAVERLRAGSLDVALIVYERTPGFYWRGAVALWFALVVSAAAYATIARRPEALPRVARALGLSFVPLLLLLALLAHRFA